MCQRAAERILARGAADDSALRCEIDAVLDDALIEAVAAMIGHRLEP
jgi:hypothetical protein